MQLFTVTSLLKRGVLKNPWGVTSVNFCWVCAAGLLESLPHYSLFCGQLQTASGHLLPLLLRIDPLFRLKEKRFTFHIQYIHSGTFANRTYLELSCPQNQKMCDPILTTVLKMQPHYSQCSREHASSSSGTSPLAPYKEVPPPPGEDLGKNHHSGYFYRSDTW